MSTLRTPKDSPLVPRLLIGASVLLTLVVVVAPLLVIFTKAISKGLEYVGQSLSDADMLHAMTLTLITVLIVVPVNVLFGVAAAWLIARYDFPGRRWVLAAVELPLSISPIVAGVCYLFVYGSQGWWGPWLIEHDLQFMFALPGIVLVTIFVTSPFVARELIPLMQAQGSAEEQVARTLGATGWQTFLRVTLPNIRWALLYGTVLCAARAIGEFGAVSVVSGNIRGETNTLPLHVELLYHDYDVVGAFAAASTLTVIALLTLVVKAWLERRAD